MFAEFAHRGVQADVSPVPVAGMISAAMMHVEPPCLGCSGLKII